MPLVAMDQLLPWNWRASSPCILSSDPMNGVTVVPWTDDEDKTELRLTFDTQAGGTSSYGSQGVFDLNKLSRRGEGGEGEAVQ